MCPNFSNQSLNLFTEIYGAVVHNGTRFSPKLWDQLARNEGLEGKAIGVSQKANLLINKDQILS